MEPARHLRVARRWWWVIVAGLLVGGGSAYAISQVMTPIYRATVTLLVNQTQVPGVIAYNDVLASERLTKTYRELVTQQPVLEEVAADAEPPLTADELASMIEVGIVPDTQLLRLSVKNADPVVARQLANDMAALFIENNESNGLARPGTVSIVEPAHEPRHPVLPRTTWNVLIGALAGVLAACVIAVVYEYLDDTIKAAEDIEAATGLATLGGVPRYAQLRAEGLAAAASDGPAHEAYRMLRTNLQFSTFDAKTLLVTSPNAGEGKTTITSNLAVAIAQTGLRTVLVDADLRRPAVHRVFGLGNGAGLTSALLSPETDVTRFLQPTELRHLVVMTSGPLPPNPSELLSSSRLEATLEALKQHADVVLFDSPPALAVADASILAGKVDATMLVVNPGKTRVHALRRSAETLALSRTRVLGVVLNKLTRRSPGYYGYGYTYGYAANNSHDGHKHLLPWRRKTRAREETATFA